MYLLPPHLRLLVVLLDERLTRWLDEKAWKSMKAGLKSYQITESVRILIRARMHYVCSISTTPFFTMINKYFNVSLQYRSKDYFATWQHGGRNGSSFSPLTLYLPIGWHQVCGMIGAGTARPRLNNEEKTFFHTTSWFSTPETLMTLCRRRDMYRKRSWTGCFNMTSINTTTAFSGHSNQGFQLASNYGNVHYHTRGEHGISAKTRNVRMSSMLTASLYSREASSTKPNPFSTVPFRRDPDFVDRDILAEVGEKCWKPASRVALVGLGGVG